MKMDDKMKELHEKIKQMEKETIEQIRQIGYYVDTQSRAKFIVKIVEIDGVSYEEACRMVVEDPQYSLGWKMCGCPILKIIMSKKETEKFREILTPEEDKIFTEEVLKVNMKKILKKEIKKQKKGP